MSELLPIFLRTRLHNFLSSVSLTLEMFLLETKKRVTNVNVVDIAHFTIKTIPNLYNLFLESFDSFLFVINFLVKSSIIGTYLAHI